MPIIPLFLLKENIRRQVTRDDFHGNSYTGIDELIQPELPEQSPSGLDRSEIVRTSATFHLLRDLGWRGWQGRLSKDGSENVVLSLKNPDAPLSKLQIRQQMEHRRLEQILQSQAWIRAIEPKVMRYFADGTQISPFQITPELEECQTQEQKDIFRYCRLLSSVPYSEYVGRRLHFLIRDASLPSRPIIGVAALGSSLMQIRCRDEWIGWNTKELRDVKKLRVANLMDLYVAISIPPYSDLLGGKLICYMMASNEVRKAFESKYHNASTLGKKRIARDLVMIVTTSIYGKHSSQYNRVRFNGNLLYIPVGETAGFGSWHIGEDTFSAFLDMLSLDGIEESNRFGEGANWRLRVIRKGMDHLGFSSDQCLRHGHPRGVYLTPLARNSQEYLLGKTDAIEYYDYPLKELVSYWRERWLGMRAGNPSVMQRVGRFKADSLRLTQMVGMHV